jgi:hypothetical protein
MFKIERHVTNRDGEIALVRVVFDTDGVVISADDGITGNRVINLTHEENDTIYDLLTLAHPAYKTGTSTDQ